MPHPSSCFNETTTPTLADPRVASLVLCPQILSYSVVKHLVIIHVQ